jgi:hypothetical protein
MNKRGSWRDPAVYDEADAFDLFHPTGVIAPWRLVLAEKSGPDVKSGVGGVAEFFL